MSIVMQKRAASKVGAEAVHARTEMATVILKLSVLERKVDIYSTMKFCKCDLIIKSATILQSKENSDSSESHSPR
jgi:hypothetical protein